MNMVRLMASSSRSTRQLFLVTILVFSAVQFFYLFNHLTDHDVRRGGKADIILHTRTDVRSATGGEAKNKVKDAARTAKLLKQIMGRNGVKGRSRSSTKVSHENYSPLMYNSEVYFSDPYQPLLFGRRRDDIGFLTIGIPSVRRPNTNKVYLFDTVDSIILNTNSTEQSEVTVVVFMSDFNETYNQYIADELYVRYQNYCDSGFIHVLVTTPDIYPDLENLPSTFNDPKLRLKWRAKQNIDFAYLALYSRNISQYYIQLEDDIITASDYVSYISNFIAKQSSNWFLLEFSHLGFIGKLFKSSDLSRLAYYLLSFFDQMPGDLMLGFIRQIMFQNKPIHSQHSLFQHVGKFSSLKDKMMPSIDARFKDAGKVNLSINSVPKGDNPKVIIDTNLEQYENYSKEYAYDNSEHYFWAKTPSRSSYFSVLFQQPYNISRIVINTGNRDTKVDSLSRSSLLLATDGARAKERTHSEQCGSFKEYAAFIDGEIDTEAMGKKLPENVVCLKIVLKQTMKHWVIIRNIIVLL